MLIPFRVKADIHNRAVGSDLELVPHFGMAHARPSTPALSDDQYGTDDESDILSDMGHLAVAGRHR